MKQKNEAEAESRRMELENKLAELQAQIRTIEKQSGSTEYIMCVSLIHSLKTLLYRRDSIRSDLKQKRKQLDYLKSSIQPIQSFSASQEELIRQSLSTLQLTEVITRKQQLQALKEQEEEFQSEVEKAEESLARHKKEFPLKKRKNEYEQLEKANEVMESSLLEYRKAVKQLRIKCIKLEKEKERLKLALHEEKIQNQQRKRELQSISLIESTLSHDFDSEFASIPQGNESTLWSDAEKSLSIHRDKIQSVSHLLHALQSKQNHSILEQLSVFASEQSEMSHALSIIVNDLSRCEVALALSFSR